MNTYKAGKEAEKLIEEINGLRVDNEIKQKVKDTVIEQTKVNLMNSLQGVAESRSRVSLNEQQCQVLEETVNKIINDVGMSKREFQLNTLKVTEELKGMWKSLGQTDIDLSIKKDRLTLETITGIIQSISSLVKLK